MLMKENTYKLILKIRASEESEEIVRYFIAWKPFPIHDKNRDSRAF